MSDRQVHRVMWLLNHTTLRKFEIEQLKRAGVNEIFLPKSFPYDEGNLSATVTYDLDCGLSIPRDHLEILNDQDWYGEPSAAAWKLANQYFDIVIIGFFPLQINAATRHFNGAVVLRAFGLGGEETYSKLIQMLGGATLESVIRRCGRRFWFGMGYEHLADIEFPLIADRAVFLPVGLQSRSDIRVWEGKERQVFFVCPRIGSSPYFHAVYREFTKNFGDLRYLIGGAQPVVVDDPKVLGFVTNEQHAYNMAQSRVMFYHSQEPNHIHYHPFEAIRAGMPLVFMAGGMLDRMGGIGLPGRCASIQEARRKIDRILGDDWDLIERIRASQPVLLEPMRPENCEDAWRAGFDRIVADLTAWRAEQALRPDVSKRKRVAVILPIAYRGGSLRGAQLLAQALALGSRACGESTDVVFLHIDDPASYPEDVFVDWPTEVRRRPFNWKTLPAGEARRAMRYAGFADWEPVAEHYMVPDDGIRQLQDCDLWLVVSDRLSLPVLPLKPMILMVYDYLQRYEAILPHGADQPFLTAARSAERILVTTEFGRSDALQYAGIDPRKVSKVPMLAPEFPIRSSEMGKFVQPGKYFIWTTNAAPHKNHAHAAEALQIYYEELDGQLDCIVTGVNSKGMLCSELPHLKAMAEIYSRSKILRKRTKWRGELPDAAYRQQLGGARFLWHAGRIDNGTFSVVEAACLGIPALSSDYPAMREMDSQFSLSLAWMDPSSPQNMAEQLKLMEVEADKRRNLLPTPERLASQRVDQLARSYWEEVRTCL